jgi:hypothetical protein
MGGMTAEKWRAMAKQRYTDKADEFLRTRTLELSRQLPIYS